MPDPHNRTKMTGDLHLPDVESGLPRQDGMADGVGADGTPGDRGRAGDGSDEARPGRGINQAGLLKDKDAAKSEGDRTTHDSGKQPR